MKHIYLSFIALFTSLVASAQCDLQASFTAFDAGCSYFMVSNTSIENCPNAVYTTDKLQWGSGYFDGATYHFNFIQDSVMYYNSAMSSEYLFSFDPSPLVSYTINAYDAAFNLIGTSVYYYQLFLAQPAMVCSSSVTDASGCNISDGTISGLACAASITPYTIIITGPSSTTPINSNNGDFYFTNLLPGNYYISVIDGTGCPGLGSNVIVGVNTDHLEVTVYGDLNGNYFRDANEPLLEGQSFNINGTGVSFTSDANGFAAINGLPVGTFGLTYGMNDGAYQPYNVPSVNSTGCYEIGLLPNNVPIVEAYVTSGSNQNIHCVNGYNPGVFIHNIGSVHISGTITVNFDPMFSIEPLTGAVPYTSTTPGQATWTITDQDQATALNYAFHVVGPGVTNIFQGFDFTFTANLTDLSGNPILSNSWTRTPIIICGYDPNDLTADPVGEGPEHFIMAGDEITYTIRFQNTGNAPAQNINVEDILDVTKFDMSTVQAVQSSHSFQVVKNQFTGAINFVFNNIMLPDSTADEPGSHGFITFKVRNNFSNPPGSVINNIVNIYFDQNPAITTNSVFHTIFPTIGVDEQAQSGLSLSPNPMNNSSVLRLPSADCTVEMFDIMGRTQLVSQHISANTLTIHRNSLADGVYFIKVIEANQSTSTLRLVIKNN